MATFTFYQDFKEQLGKGVHNLSSNSLKWALTNTAPSVSTHTTLSNITQLSTGGGYTGGAGGGVAVNTPTYTETSGTGTLAAGGATVITASGGTIGPFRYAVLYNDSTTSPTDALIGYLDYGSSITLADTEPFTIPSGTIFTVA